MPRQRAKDPVQEAIKILKDMEIESPAVPVEKIAKLLRATVRFSPFDDDISGLISIRNDQPVIGVNSLHHPHRQRFTLAHEIGHLILHRDLLSEKVHVDKQFKLFRRDGHADEFDGIENAANRFAAELTMPKAFLTAALLVHKHNTDDSVLIKQLAQQFKMSEDAMKIRMSTLFSVWR